MDQSEPRAADQVIRGIALYREFLDLPAQQEVLQALRRVIAAAPLFHPQTQRGKQMTVRMTSAGKFGWVSDRRGYRYEPCHPAGMPWPPIPPAILRIWNALSGSDRQPESCLVNFYGEGARMGLHQDRDEKDMGAPVVSLSLGDEGLFRVGNLERGGPTQSVWLHSGDVLVMGGAARLTYHGIDRIRFGSSRLTPRGGRINVTLRVVT
ncbi:alpha-ketoglutarate-dependent dioxygenase AlkB family protein [Profundibacterium mesophilum]|uniref:Alpha-ketoglutarate-dependent dioxygenase AlkB like protein n=1 Tax=Profundibacterium mesophilum KAUST100406-0324 TaxID=1037889 RepID=A0A921NX53_9RHOB|nr:alpha-ketoglutarate-dependent dioxygenase AlkB [Profundibacterium mesophilum]KAF0676374.1 Alpha-ketoglutarate-dependent dioxygenase AlkB like protein [Profundibacterium mesophilum KAUST100406-0324]